MKSRHTYNQFSSKIEYQGFVPNFFLSLDRQILFLSIFLVGHYLYPNVEVFSTFDNTLKFGYLSKWGQCIYEKGQKLKIINS